MNNTMKAIKIQAYGGREQLTLENVAIPSLKANDVLVKVHAAAINPVDWKVREGMLAGMLPHQLPLTLGWDFSGEIVAKGDNVNEWDLGAHVYARPDIARDGSYAEYIAVDASEIATKPKKTTWQQAAAVPLAALTAWQALYEVANIKQGDRVLIHAGAGGVGLFAIQLAKLRGAYIYTTSSTRNISLLHSMGATEVIDYTHQDFSDLRDLDVVLDTLGHDALEKSWQCLKKGGVMVSIIAGANPEKALAFNVRSEFVFVQPSSKQLTELAQLIDEDKLTVTIDSEFSLHEVAKAHERSESGRAQGKIILNVASLLSR